MRKNSVRWFLTATICIIGLGSAVFLLGACASPTADSGSSPTARDVSSDISGLATSAFAQANSSASDSAVDETSVATESSSSSVNILSFSAKGLALEAAPIKASITVTHTHLSANTAKTISSLGTDVVTVVRTWVNSGGDTVVDTVTRPEIPIPASGSFSDPSSGWTSTGITTSNVSLSFNASTWTLNGTETRTVAGVQISSSLISLTYDTSAHLLTFERTGESLGPNTGNVKLSTLIFYSYTYPGTSTSPQEYLRVYDYVSATSATLKREVYVWNATAAIVNGIPNSTASTLTMTPTLPTSGYDFIYQSDPTVALTALAPVAGTASSYPILETNLWVRLVTQRAGPRVVDWYKPINQGSTASPSFNGTYVRHYEYTTYANGSGVQTTTFSLTNGTTVIATSSAVKFKTVANGTYTTTWKFSDGITSSISITPTTNGYDVTRDLPSGKVQTYSVTYTLAADGSVSTIVIVYTSVTPNVTHTFTQNTDGTWSES